MEVSKHSNLKVSLEQNYLNNLQRIAKTNFNADKYALSSRINKKSELVTEFNQVEVGALVKLVIQLKKGSTIAVHKKVERLKQLKKELELLEKKKIITKLCENIYNSRPVHFSIHLPQMSDSECEQLGIRLDSAQRLDLITVNRIEKELNFYSLRDRNKPTKKDILSIITICIFILLKKCIFQKSKGKKKVNSDEFIAGILNTFIGECLNVENTKHKFYSTDNFTKKLRRYMADPIKKYNIYRHMKSVGVADLFDNHLKSNI